MSPLLTTYHKAQFVLMLKMLRQDIVDAYAHLKLACNHLFQYLIALVRGGTI